MQRIITASADTYITNKIINNSFRATDGNVGQAGTIDLFKLYDESSLSGSTTPIELTRALIKFDYEEIRSLTSSVLDLNNFNATLKLFDVYGGQTTPTNFTVSVMPLSKTFDEGFGRDLTKFQDLDVANWFTSSESSGRVAWVSAGAGSVGALGETVDVIEEGDIGNGLESLESTQIFSTGEENLEVDVTKIVSGALIGALDNYGFRISFSGSQETDTKTRFVKRFYSRHSSNKLKTPRIILKFDDAIQDDHENFYFDVTGSLFLNNYARGIPANIVSGSSLTEIQGQNSLLLTLTSGSYTQSFTASQHRIGGNDITGVYSATFAIPSNNSSLVTEIRNAGSATFTESWGSLDGTVPYHSSTLVIKSNNVSTFNRSQRRINVNVTNSRSEYSANETARFRVYAFDYDEADDFKASRLPIEAKSIIFRNMHYRIVDFNSQDIVVPFDLIFDSTKMSTDSEGMYFDFHMSMLPPGRVYDIQIFVDDRGVKSILKDVGGRFRIDTR